MKSNIFLGTFLCYIISTHTTGETKALALRTTTAGNPNPFIIGIQLVRKVWLLPFQISLLDVMLPIALISLFRTSFQEGPDKVWYQISLFPLLNC